MFTLLLTILFLCIGCTNAKPTTSSNQTNKNRDYEIILTISAAISLTDILGEVKDLYENESQVNLTLNVSGSGTLAQQIIQGAPVDVFISANQQWMDTLEEEGFIQTDTRSDITSNNLVLITDKSSPIAYRSLREILAKDINKIAIGNPESVPAGGYAKETLQNLKIWDQLKNKLVFAKDVRQVLTYVETGNADIGFVYESDALGSEKVKIIATADKQLHDPIIYPGAVLTDTKHKQEAIDFITFMKTAQVQEILGRYGFKRYSVY